jgi:hypothetical protein
MTLKASAASRNAMLDAIIARIPGGILRIYSGTRPADVATAVTGGNVVLAELTLGTPAAGAAVGGSVSFNAITQDSSANATGTASFFRIFQSNGTTAELDGDVFDSAGANRLQLNTVSLVAGGPVQVTSFSITAPGA